MGNLAAAGIVSGLGQGLQQGLAQLNSGIIQYGLHSEDRKFQEAKLKEQMAHAEKLAAGSQAHAEKLQEGTLNAAESRLGKEISSREKEGEAGRGSAEKIHGLDEASREKIAREGNATHKEIAAASNAVHLKIAELNNKLQHQQLNATELTAVQHYIDSLGDDIRGVELKLLDPLADPSSVIGKTLIEDLKLKKTQLARAQAQFDARVSDMQMKDKVPMPKSVAPAEKKPFNSGQYGTAPAPSRSGGIIQTPMPSAIEQEMMRKAIQ
jgi:hypothetical protein